MSGPENPTLIQFGVAPRSDPDCDCLEVDPCTGLLHKPGMPGPYVEHLIALGREWQEASGNATILTESKDPADPDLVRTESLRRLLSTEVSTMVSKTAAPDPMDPDLVRTDSLPAAFTCALSTVTRGQRDPQDPDLVRAGDAAFMRP